MSKFDTHGGYFSPKDYTRVSEGGSHEENPNGGVQLGVDPEGNPNLLEEGEPVYKDYVYSDNILADREFLEQFNLPVKYAGKLYSKIADDFVTEAEERPLDPISRSGLEAMLGRLAEAQEAQKQRDQQNELEAELANLSPEELDELEAMLAQQEMPQEQMVPEEQMQPQMMAPEQTMLQQPVEGMPMMGCGGKIRRFDDGGPLEEGEPESDNIEDNIDEILAKLQMANAAKSQYNEANSELSLAKSNYGSSRLWDRFLGRDSGTMDTRIAAAEKELVRKLSVLAENKGGIYSDPNGSYYRNMMKEIEASRNNLRSLREKRSKYSEKANKRVEEINELQNRVDSLYRVINGPQYGLNGTYLRSTPTSAGSPSAPVDTARSRVYEYAGAPADTSAWDNLDYEGVSDHEEYDAIDASSAQAPNTASRGLYDIVIPAGYGNYRFGGRINRFDGGGWADFLKRLAAYDYSKNPSAVAGKYAIDRRSDVWGGRTARQIEADKAYQDFTDYVIANSKDENVREYLRALDRGVAEGTPLLFNGDELVNGWDAIFRHRRTDGDLGIYHLNPEDIAFLTAAQNTSGQNAPALAQVNQAQFGSMYPLGTFGQFPRRSGIMYDWVNDNPTGTRYVPRDIREGATLFPNGTDAGIGGLDASAVFTGGRRPTTGNNGNLNPTGQNNTYGNVGILPTWPRYSGAVASGLLGLYNAFTPADRYNFARMNPQLPYGRINLQNQVYNPVDQNMVANAQIAQGNATNRALRNSGLGPSTAQAVLAADNNLTGNLGTGFIQTWDANDQRRNAVLAANNQAEGTRANFDYGVDQQRKAILNDAAYKNANIDMMRQRLNYAADADKYQAIGNQIDAATEALSNIGKENFQMNQINSNRGFLGYGTSPNGWMTYNPGMWQYANPYMNPFYFALMEEQAKKKGGE